MAEITKGLKELAKRELLPTGDYRFRIDRVGVTKNGNGEGAFLIATKAPEEDLVGKRSYLYLYNYVSEQGIGLSQLLASLQLLDVPDGEHGDRNTQNLVGVEFDANVSEGVDKTNGQPRNNVNPEYDSEWLEHVRNASDAEIAKMSRSAKPTRKKRTAR